MRILVCAEEAPIAPATGLRVALASLIERLQETNEVRVLGFRSSEQSAEASDALRLVDRRSLRRPAAAPHLAAALMRGHPLSIDDLAAQMRPALREELDMFRPDAVHVCAGRLTGLGRTLMGWPSVLSAYDAAHKNAFARVDARRGAKRMMLRREARAWHRLEATEWRRFGAVTVSSVEDRDTLEEMDPTLVVRVMPLGIVADRFSPVTGVRREDDLILFHGVMNYAPNVAAAVFLAREIFPRVRERRPSAHLRIVGRSPNAEVAALASLPGVTVTGEVADLASTLSEASVYVCAMRNATGAKNKLLEAMANELPCVVTPLARRGIDAVAGTHLLEATTPEDLAAAIEHVLAHPTEARELGREAARFVRAHHDWAAIADAYVDLYRELSVHKAARAGEPA